MTAATREAPSAVEHAGQELRRIEAARESVLKGRRKTEARAAAARAKLGALGELETQAALGERDPAEVAALREEAAAIEREAADDLRRIDEHVLPGIERRLEGAQQEIRLAQLEELHGRIVQGGRERLAISAGFAEAKDELARQGSLLVAARAQVEADEREAASIAKAAGVEPPRAPDEPEWGDDWKPVSLRAFGYQANPEVIRQFVAALALGPEQTQLVELLLVGPVRSQAAAVAAAGRAEEASQRARAASVRWAAENMVTGHPRAIEQIPEEFREDARREADRLLAFRGGGEVKAGTRSAPTLEEFNAAGRADVAERAASERERVGKVQEEWDAKHGPRPEADEPEVA